MNRELVGRMQLWFNALADCRECLILANRLGVSSASDAVRSEEKAIHAHYEEVTGRRLDLLVSCSDDRKVIETFERSLLTPRDCQLAAYHLHKLAIVYFMQLYVDGDDDPGKVAANKGLAEMERSRLEALAFTDVNDLKKFRQLVLQLRTIRNKQLGHASGPEFSISHQPKSVGSVINAVTGDLLRELQDALQKLMPVIQQRIGNLIQAERSS